MNFLPKEKNNLCLRYAALRIWRRIDDIPGSFVRAMRFDIGFSPRLSLSNHGKRGIDTNGGEPRRKLAGPTKSSQVRVGAEQGFLHCIFGILPVTDNGNNSLSGSLSVPPAELSKSLVVTRLSSVDKIIIRTLDKDRQFRMAAVGRLFCECPRFEPPGFVSSLRHGSPQRSTLLRASEPNPSAESDGSV
jgi:hypothetical protein